MVDSIDVCTAGFAQSRPVHRGENEITIGNAIQLFMRGVQGDPHFRKAGKHRHTCEDLLTQINYFNHSRSLSDFEEGISSHPVSRSYTPPATERGASYYAYLARRLTGILSRLFPSLEVVRRIGRRPCHRH